MPNSDPQNGFSIRTSHPYKILTFSDTGKFNSTELDIWPTAEYRNDPKFSVRQVLANSADPDQEQSDQGLHSLPIFPHLLDALLFGRNTLFKF